MTSNEKAFMSRSIILFFIPMLLSIGCRQLSSNGKTIISTLGKEIEFPKLNLYNENKSIEQWRDNYNNISIVCFYEGCVSCYPKFTEWLHKMDSIGVEKNDNILFFIRGRNASAFIERAKGISHLSFRYGLVLDSTSYFLRLNNQIPESIFENSFTIDKTNRIRLIGAPFATPKMTALYREICAK